MGAEFNENHKTVGESFETEQFAIELFKQKLPKVWMIREQKPDFHIDYLIEPTLEGELTGIQAGIQLKGVKDLDLKGQVFKTKHLRYYFDKCPFPVFLIRVDVTNKQAFWCFLQKFTKEKVTSTQLNEQETITIQPAEFEPLNDIEVFHKAIIASETFVRDLHPGTVLAAMKSEIAKIEKLDPRFKVEMDVANGVQNITLKAKEPIKLQLRIRAEHRQELEKAFGEFIERGAELKLKKGQFQIIGSEIFNTPDVKSSEGELTIRSANILNPTIKLSANSANYFSLDVPGRFQIGTKYATFSGSLVNCPFSVELVIQINHEKVGADHSFRYIFSPAKWENKTILFLPYFEQVYDFFDSLNRGTGAKIEVFVDGNRILGFSMLHTDEQEVQSIMNLLEPIKKCRVISEKFGINPTLPPLKDIKEEQLLNIEMIYDLMLGNEVIATGRNFIFSASFENLPSAIQAGKTLHNFQEIVSQTFQIFGESLSVGKMQVCLSKAIFAEVDRSNPGSVRLDIQGTHDSEALLKLIPAQNT